MGKATIVSNHGDGLYTIMVNRALTRRNDRLTWLESRKDELVNNLIQSAIAEDLAADSGITTARENLGEAIAIWRANCTT